MDTKKNKILTRTPFVLIGIAILLYVIRMILINVIDLSDSMLTAVRVMMSFVWLFGIVGIISAFVLLPMAKKEKKEQEN